MRYFSAVILILNLLSISVFAQENSLQILVKDQSNQVVSHCPVLLLNVKDSSLISSGLTNEMGIASFEKIKQGEFFVRIQQIGFEKFSSEKIIVDGKKLMKEFVLKSNATQLKKVNVVAQKSFIEMQTDKLIVNVEGSSVNAGNNGYEVLQHSPGVKVDEDGNVGLNGRNGAMVMIDDKRTYLSGTDLVNFLKSTPASQIEKVELMKNPSSKYDAQGSGGIINIKLKKDRRLGSNASINGSYGQGVYAKRSGGINFNFRNKKMNCFASYSLTKDQGYVLSYLNRGFNANQLFAQRTELIYGFTNHNLRTGFDYNLSPKTTIGAVLSGVYTSNPISGNTAAQLLANDVLQNHINTINSRTDVLGQEDLNLNFKHTIDSLGNEITADFDFTNYNQLNQQHSNTNYTDANSIVSSPDLIIRGNLPASLQIYSFKTDYVHPFNKTLKLETGVKSSFVKNNSDVRYYLTNKGIESIDLSRTNHFIFSENINAAYATLSKDFSKVSLQFGLRAEQTNNKGMQETIDSTSINNYVQLFPTFFATYQLNDKNTFEFSLNRRINRPQYPDLNPFRYFLDPYTYRVGNPFLKPELTNGIQITHAYKSKIFTTVSYQRTTDAIAAILQQNESTKISQQTNDNAAKNETVSLSINSNLNFTKWWMNMLTLNFDQLFFVEKVNGITESQQNLFKGITMNNNFKLGKGWSAELNGYYYSSWLLGLFKFIPSASISAGIQKSIMKKQGTLKLSIRDAFFTENSSLAINYQDVNTDLKRVSDSRVVTIAFSYRFGNTQMQQIRKHSGGSDDEKKRLNGNT